MFKRNSRRLAVLAATSLVMGTAYTGALLSSAVAGTPISGAIFTTDQACDGTDLNIYADRGDVYLDGGPAHAGAAGLPDGEYYVQVTAPDGTLLGTSLGASDETPVTVTDGEFVACPRLWDILIKASDSSGGYDETTNPGGEYKVWVSTVSTFDNDLTKTDNFKVNESAPTCVPPDPNCTPEETVPELTVEKFYDANTNGVQDGSEPFITGWKINIADGVNYDRYTPVDIFLAPDTYTVSEYQPVETNWHATTDTSTSVTLTVSPVDVQFGNVCVGAGGGRTLGYWSNKNGQKSEGASALVLLSDLNLVKADGSDFDPTSTSTLRTWLLSGTATNMAYMLSVQLAAMELNVFNHLVDDAALIYAPGTTSANGSGFATVNDVMAEANDELGLHPVTLSGSPYRSYQEALKNALDNANNNLTFVQASPCAFSFS